MEHLACLIILSLALKEASGDGRLSVRFVSYVNPGGKGANGHCCDGRSIFCSTQCDHMFELCVDYFYGDDNINHCAIGKRSSTRVKNKNSITFTNSISDLPNPIVFAFTDWQVPGIKIKLRVMDYDVGSSHDFVEYIKKRININPAKNDMESTEMLVNVASRTTLTVKLKAYCDTNWYGPNCMIYCVPTNDRQGHYDCNEETGDKKCHRGWEGSNCDHKIDYCRSSPCQHNSTCQNQHYTFACVCSSGYTGINCETNIDECSSSPCVQGDCRDGINSFQCQCHEGFEGVLCNHSIDYCQDIYCENNATCISTASGFNCKCAQKFTGLFCESLIESCISNPCDNDSRCKETDHGYICEMLLTTDSPLSPTTEIQVTTTSSYNCSSSPCQNNGTCIDTNDGYNCTCPDGIIGQDCNNISITNSSTCEDVICQNNSTCSISVVGPYCNCTPEWTGEFCNISISTSTIQRDVCENIHCQNNGSCELMTVAHSPNYNKSGEVQIYFICVCQEGYTGEFCELKNSTNYMNSENDDIDVNLSEDKGYSSALLFDGTLTVKDISEILQKVKQILASQNGGHLEEIQVNYEIRKCLSEQSTNVDILVFNIKIQNTVIPWENVDAAFSDYTFDSLDQSFPIPLYEGDICTPIQADVEYQKVFRKPWLSRYWYVIVIVVIILISAILGTALMIYRNRKRTAKIIIKEYPTDTAAQNGDTNKENDLYSQVNKNIGTLNYFENEMFEYDEIQPTTSYSS